VRTGDSVERIVQAFEMRWYMAAELEHLLARAGFHVEARYGSFERAPLTDEAPEIVMVVSSSSEFRQAKSSSSAVGREGTS
jgi:hypothetical protein